MSTALELGNLTGTVSFSRKVSDNNYGGSDAFFAIQFPIEEGDTPETIALKANTNYATCKAMVNAQLGLAPEDQVATALIQNAFGPGVQVSTEPSSDSNVVPINTPAAQLVEAVQPTAATVGPNPPHGGDYKSWSPAQKNENTEWAKARFASNPEEFWDNTIGGKKNPKGPDAKHRESGIGIWFS